MSLEPPKSDPAAEAFERLRLEVALLRRAVESLAGEGAAKPPDYSPTLARLGKAVVAVDERVQALGETTVLALTGEQLSDLLQRAARLTTAPVIAELGQDRAAFSAAAGSLKSLQSEWRTLRAGWRRALAFMAGGVLVGAVALAALLGPVARALPSGWQVPERLAAATLAAPRADAGARLLRGADPERWRRLLEGEVILAGDDDGAASCLSRATKADQPFRCQFRMDPRAMRAIRNGIAAEPQGSGG